MPSPTTALTIIRDALALTNSVGADQTLDADEVADSLRAFNDLLEIFSTRDLAVYGSALQPFNTVIGQAAYTIGPSANWATVRPVRINDTCFVTYQSTRYPVPFMTQDEYNAIPVPTQTRDFPARMLYNNEFPLGRITFWPVPSSIVAVTLDVDTILTAVSNAATSISYPPGYAMAFKYKLAIMLAPMFGKKMSQYPDIMAIANSSFADICRANKKIRKLEFGSEFSQAGYGMTVQQFLSG